MTSPYRDGKPLSEVIAPDRRRHRAIMVAIGGMVVGAFLIELLRGAFTPTDYAQATIPTPPPGTLTLPGQITQEEVMAVVTAHRTVLRDTCFRPRSDLDSGHIFIDIEIDVRGEVSWTKPEGTDKALRTCVDGEIRKWHFPAHAEQSARFGIPFNFERT